MDLNGREKEEMYRVELIVSALLRIGVVLSAIIIVFGLVMLFITGESGYPGKLTRHHLRRFSAG